MADSFAHLHVHTEYSMLDGATRIDDLMRHVARMGQPAVAMTDHGNMFGAIDFFRAGREHGVKPILGSEVYVAPNSRFDRTGRKATSDADAGKGDPATQPYQHLILLAESQSGYANLMRLVSRAYLEGYWYKPRADRELLEEFAEGLICLSGCLGGEVNQYLLAGRYEEARAAAAWYRDVFGPDNYFIELQDHGIPEQRRTNPELIRIARDLGVGLVATNDSHYTTQADQDAHDVLLCIQTGSRRDDANRFRIHGDQHFVKSSEQMQALFGDHPETWRNTLAIAERCDVEIEFGRHHLPRFPLPEGVTEAQQLRRDVHAGALRRYAHRLEGGDVPGDVRERLDHELQVIEQMGFPAYFLIVADLCNHAREVGIRLGPGRGSAAGCAVAYCTGITDLDPIEHDLIFERFLNPERVSMPDIDLDFDERRRGEMIRYAAEKYGQDRVAQIVTFSTIKAKQAMKDAARVLGYPYGFGDRLAKMMPPPVMGKDYPLAKARELSAELRTAWESEPDAKQVLDTALSLEGLRRQHSIHAAGVVISAEPVTDHCPVLRVEADGEVVTQYDGGMVEAIGLLKMDFLGLRNLTVISDALDHIERVAGERVEIEDVPLDDATTYAMLASGDTDGVFQLDSPGMKALVRQLKPDSFDDIVALLALYRPGPMAAGLHTEYARRKHGQSKVAVPHPDLMPILETSYGILVYQEQVLQIAQRIAGFSLGQADLLRRAIGKKKQKEMDAQKAAFLAGTVEQGYDAKLGQSLWDLIEGFADYAFNKSHSAGYGLVSYQTAWLKANHPVAYMAALLTSVKNNKDRLPLYLGSCRQMGLEVLPPDVNASEQDFAPVPGSEKQIRFGLSAVRNVGVQVVDQIIDARRREGAFTDFADFARKVSASCLNRRTVESLVKAGAFESLGHPRKGLLLVAEQVCDEALTTKRAESEGQFSLFGEMDGADEPSGLSGAIEVPDEEFARRDLLAAEREMLGLYVTDHPLAGLERALEQMTSTSIASLLAEVEERGGVRGEVTLAGVVAGVTKKFTKRGEPYVVVALEDLAGSIEVIAFPSVYTASGDLLVEDTVVCVTGRLDESDTPRMIASGVSVPDLSDAEGPPLRLRVAAQQCTDDVLSQVRDVLRSHPGAVPVQVHLHCDDRPHTTLTLGPDLAVGREPGLFAELKSLLGPEAVH